MDEFKNFKNQPYVMVRHKGLHMPGALSKGDKIGIISLSGYDAEEVISAMSVIASYGFVPVLSHTIQNSNIKSGIIPRGERVVDLYVMLEDPEIKAIICCGDGSGSIEILPNFSYRTIAGNPKWLVGHGDITALLSLWVISDIAPIHGPMCADLISDGPEVKALFNLMSNGGKLDYIFPVSPNDRTGKAVGHLIGGNLSVLSMLGGTSYDLISHYFERLNVKENGVILFLEDSGISFKHVRDILLTLYLSNSLLFVKGLIFGSFQGCKPYGNLSSIVDVVEELEHRWMLPPDIPVVFDFPFGSVSPNFPWVEAQQVCLEVSKDLVSLHSFRP